MLFPYKFIEHDICKLNTWIEYLFTEVWCKAELDYSLDLLNGCPELKNIAEIEAYKEDPAKKPKDYITGPISMIYDLFKTELDIKQRNKLRKIFLKSRNIEKGLEGQKYYFILTTDDLNQYSEKLATELHTFYVNLFDSVLDLSVVRNQNGTLKNHYDEFVRINNAGICPFCGISTLRSYMMDGHEAYDHFLPKENYSSYSINFKNLVPCCHDCNSIHKLRKSPIGSRTTGTSNRAYYPYANKLMNFKINITVNISHYKEYEHDHISLNFVANKKIEQEKVNAWSNLYNIDKRYKDHLTNGAKGKYWLLHMLEELDNDEDRMKELERLTKIYDKKKFDGENLLKTPFLLACKKEGIY